MAAAAAAAAAAATVKATVSDAAAAQAEALSVMVMMRRLRVDVSLVQNRELRMREWMRTLRTKAMPLMTTPRQSWEYLPRCVPNTAVTSLMMW